MLAALKATPVGRAYLVQTASPSRAEIRIREGSRICVINRALALTFLPVCLVDLLLALWLLARSAQFSEGAARGAWLTIFLLLPNFTNTFAISLLHTMDVDRYSQVQFGTALLAELWIVVWVLDLLIDLHPTFRRDRS